MSTTAQRRRPMLLPDPSPREVHYTLISVDDHLVEPAHTFVRRMPARYADLAPKVIVTDSGAEAWTYDGQVFVQLGLNAVVGRDDTLGRESEPTHFDEMRRGCYDPAARVADMDINGVWASLNFPSTISGFCGAVFSRTSDAELGQSVMRAWNDWAYDEWYAPYPERFIPLGITWLADAQIAAAEIRRNAARGFKAVSLPEQPHRLGYPSLHSGYWDPVIEACVETDTVVCLHVGSSGNAVVASDAPGGIAGVLFSALSLNACVDWLWSALPIRYPDLKIAMSEGGIGWVPMLMDRLDFVMSRARFGRAHWPSTEVHPTEVLQRNFWFCSIDDPSVLPCVERIGIERVMLEVDYPHADSTWPDTQELLAERLATMSDDVARKITHENAAGLFRHPLPRVRRP
ncbi:MAG TPA: amidohydrolase family protein [Ilumatobacteraceae bacterium]